MLELTDFQESFLKSAIVNKAEESWYAEDEFKDLAEKLGFQDLFE